MGHGGVYVLCCWGVTRIELGFSIDLTVFDAILINKLVRTPKKGSFDVGVVFKMHTERRRV